MIYLDIDYNLVSRAMFIPKVFFLIYRSNHVTTLT